MTMSGSRRIEPHRANNRASLTVAAALAVAVAPVASSRPAASQQTPAAGPAATGGEIAPPGQREVKDVSYGDRKKLCFKPGAAKMVSRTSIAGTFPTGQMTVPSTPSSAKATPRHGCRCSAPSACICRSRPC
jgi:hypothetical protein